MKLIEKIIIYIVRNYLRKKASSYLGTYCEILGLDGNVKFQTICIEERKNDLLLRCINSGFEFTCPKSSSFLRIREFYEI